MQDHSAANAAWRLDPTAHTVSSVGAHHSTNGASLTAGARPDKEEMAPFLPDEVLQALAREPPPLVATASSARSTRSGTASVRQSIAFDRTFLMDVPGLAAPIQRETSSTRSDRPNSGSSPITSPYGSGGATFHERRKTLRGLVSSRVRLSTFGPSGQADNASALDHPAPTPRRREPRPSAPEYSSAWSRIAMAASAPTLERTVSASSTHSTPFASTASFASTSSSRMARSHTTEGRVGLGTRAPARLPDTATAVDDSDLERALADLDVRAPLRQAVPGRQTQRRNFPDRPTSGSSVTHVELASDPQADFLVAVVGPRGVGKSTLIRRAFKRSGDTLRTMTSSNIGAEAVMSSASFTMAGIRRTIDIISLDAELLDSEADGGLAWPAGVPQAEAIMLCYDASDPDALSGLSTLLKTFWTGGADVPLIVLACKSSERDAVDPAAAAELCNRYGAGIVRLDGGADDPQRKAKESFSWLIRQIMDNRGETHFYAALATPAEGPPREQYFPPQPPAPRLPVEPMRTTASFADAEPTVRLGVTETAPVSIAEQQDQRPSFVRRNLLFSSEDLVDKFLFASIAGDDEDFVNSFLITFRRFVQPARVLEQLVERFDFVSRQDSNPMLQRYGQLRLCSTLSTWLQSYPGDFSDPDTLDILRPFVNDTLSGAVWLQHYAFELAPLLPGLEGRSDPDLCWSSSTPSPNEPRTAPTTRTAKEAPAAVEISLGSAAGSSDAISLDSRGSSTGASSAPMSRQVSAVSAMLVDASNAISEMRVEEIAVQITRLAWNTWAARNTWAGITPRDALRHVLAKRDRLADSRVMRAVNFVNHLARWVATLVLVQSRPGKRALVVAHFVLVAAELRKRENYDSLAGILAGLNHQAVHRLSDSFRAAAEQLDGTQAHGEIDARPKKLRSLNLLLSPAKSYAAYRLAISTRAPETVPYLGVVLQDLTVINETSHDFEEQLVNWSKMAQLARSAAILLDCPRKGPPLPADSVLETYITDLSLLNDEKLYALSYAYQPRESSPARSRLQEWLS